MALIRRFYRIENGIIAGIRECSGNGMPEGSGWTEAPLDSGGAAGDRWPGWFDENGRRIPDRILAEQGKRVDNRGRWHSKDDPGGQPLEIQALDAEVDKEKYTREAPLENEAFQKFDRAKNKWAPDAAKKERAEKEAALSKARSEIEEAERKITRSMRAKISGRAGKKDDEIFEELDGLIEKKLRPQIIKLEKELAAAG